MSVVGAVLPPGSRRVSYDVDGARLAAVWMASAAPAQATVLLVPGFTGSKEDFSPILPHLSLGGFHSGALDQRGQHESPGPADPTAYSVAALAEDLLAVADQLDGRLHVVGHSFGGLVARAAVLAMPTRFASLVLMSSGPAALDGPRVAAMDAMRPLVEAGDLLTVVDVMDAATALDERREALSDELRAFLRHRFLMSSAAALLGMGDALTSEPDRVEELAAAAIPTLVIHGSRDDAWLPEVQAEMAVRLGARHDVVTGAMHSPAAEQPIATAAALLDFWSSL